LGIFRKTNNGEKMKRLIYLLCLGCLPLMAHLPEENMKLCPLHEEDAHFIEYRVLMIETSVHSMMNGYMDLYMEGKITQDQLSIAYSAYCNILFNLGLPSEVH
jgi:hypothetical protein